MKKPLLLALVVLALSTFAWTQMEAAETTQPDSGEAVLGELAKNEAPAEQPGEGIEGLLPDDGKISMSCDENCRDQCLEEQTECKAGCGGSFPCLIACSCEMYWCVDACPGCEQDPPPLPCA